MNSKTPHGWLAGCALATLLVTAAQAQSFVYTDFSNTSNLQLNGSAATAVTGDGTVLRLTPANYWQAGSAFSLTQITLTNSSFSTAFNFRLTNSGGISDENGPGADGIVFVVEPGSNSVGGSGVGIGYQGIPNSLGVEYDTYNNGSPDHNDGNHVAINTNGNLDDTYYADVLPAMNNGALWYSWIDYNGTTNDLQVRLSQTSTRPVSPLLETTAINLASVLGQNTAYVGFTAATGAAYNNHDIVSWQFNNTYTPIDNIGGGGNNNVPDSGSTALLLGVGLLLIIAASSGHRRLALAR